MSRFARVIVLVAVVLAAAIASGCVSSEMGGSKTATGVWGFVASSKHAALEIDQTRSNVASVYVKRVVAPVDGFIYATSSNGGGVAMQVGLVPVKRGESTDILVPIMGAKSGSVTLTLFVDRAHKGLFEFNPMDPTTSPDRPVFVGGVAVSAEATVSEAAAPIGVGAALLDVFDQPAGKTVNIVHVVAPGPSWIVVFADQGGVPGSVLGKMNIGQTDALGVQVPLDVRPAKRDVFVALHMDTGIPGLFEYRSSVGATTTPGPDGPYVVGGGVVMTRISLQ